VLEIHNFGKEFKIRKKVFIKKLHGMQYKKETQILHLPPKDGTHSKAFLFPRTCVIARLNLIQDYVACH